MNTSALQPGDLIQCNVKGVAFEATYEHPCPGGLHKINPESGRYTWRFVSARQITEKLERQERLGV